MDQQIIMLAHFFVCFNLNKFKFHFCPTPNTYFFDVLVFIDTWREGRGQAFVDVRLGCQLLQGLHAVLGEEFHLRLFVQTVQALFICLAEVDDVYVGLVDRLHVALMGVDTHRDSSVDTWTWGEDRISSEHVKDG